jgi:hypothetical protein
MMIKLDRSEVLLAELARGRVGRVAARPVACDSRPGCWVEVGPESCIGHRPRCTACGGSIRPVPAKVLAQVAQAVLK